LIKPNAIKSVERTREESGNKKLSVSVDKTVSKVEMLSTGGINPFPKVVESLILVQPCQKDTANNKIKIEKE